MSVLTLNPTFLPSHFIFILSIDSHFSVLIKNLNASIEKLPEDCFHNFKKIRSGTEEQVEATNESSVVSSIENAEELNARLEDVGEVICMVRAKGFN